MIKVLLADDDPLTREGIKLVLASSGYEVVAEAENGAKALELVRTARPDLLLLDFEMPDRSGLDVLRTLRERGTIGRSCCSREECPTSASTRRCKRG